MSGKAEKTVTDKRIEAEISKLSKALCNEYDRHLGTPSPEFWEGYAEAEKLLSERLKPRPLGMPKIRLACSAFMTQFKRLFGARKATTTYRKGPR